MIRKSILIALAAGAVVALAPTAEAREGCGPGGHRNGYGDCRPNRGPYRGGPNVVLRGGPGGPALVIGNHYPGRGYWDGRRYWQHRERHRDGWRYR